jgi:hypothetical protein
MPDKMKLTLGLISSVDDDSKYSARFVSSGNVRTIGDQPSNIEITSEALSAAVTKGLFNRKAVFMDHAGWLDYPSLERLIGVTANAFWNDETQSVDGDISLYNTLSGSTADIIIKALLHDPSNSPDVGLSLVFFPTWGRGEDVDKIVGVSYVESVDLVFEPAANGRILAALSTQFVSEGENTMPDEILDPVVEEIEEEEVEEVTPPASTPDGADWVSALAGTASAQMIQASGLPTAARERLLAQSFTQPADVSSAIETERQYIATIQEDNVINIGNTPPRSATFSQMLDSIDRITLATEAMLSGLVPEKGIRPLTGIRELYTLLSGDYEMSGVFHPDRIGFANVNTSTMAGLVANALNKRVINEFQTYPQWWLPITSEEDFQNLQQVKWISLGGVGELPTVSEGAAYTELTWDDNTETADFAKKGGYLGLTLEAIDKDDTGQIRAAPRALAQAAWLTLSKAVSAIFTAASGVGPNMADGDALFHTNHSNLGTTALSYAEWVVVRTAMRKQTELNSGERLGALTAPKFLLVPPDLEVTALTVMATDGVTGTAISANVINVGDTNTQRFALAQSRVIVVDLWSDVNNWAAVADPNLYPSIGIAYRYGRVPEIFSVASPTAGLMFTNDTMPIKVRFFFATGPMDYRGMYKENVA